jgi:hypothetical protein
MSLQNITNTIDTEIRNQNNLIEQEELADVLQVLADDNYSFVDEYSGTTTNGLIYTLNVLKNGNKVTINGNLENPFNAWITGGEINLTPKYRALYNVVIFVNGDGNNTKISTVPSTGLLVGTMQGETTIRFTLTYISNNE